MRRTGDGAANREELACVAVVMSPKRGARQFLGGRKRGGKVGGRLEGLDLDFYAEVGSDYLEVGLGGPA